MKNRLVILIICVIFLSLIPLIYTYIQAGSSWSGVVPSFVGDDLYYYARMQNVVHGYPFIGNPYFFEHRYELSPAFFAADWLAVIPMKFGLPLVPTVALNFVAWSVLFSVLVYVLFRQYNLPSTVSLSGSLLTYAAMYLLMLRPVSMQMVAPFFLLFCISYNSWLKGEVTSRSQNLFLIISSALAFYIYTYLWQVVIAVLLFTALFLIYNRAWPKLKNLFIVCLGSGILGLPMIWYTLKQIYSPYYWESMDRIGLVNTYLPTALSFYEGAMILGILLLWSVAFFWINGLRDNSDYKNAFILTSLTGLGLFATLFSNVITGKELEISNHIERFIVMWISIAVILPTYFLLRFRSELFGMSFYKRGIVSFLLALSLATFGHFFVRGFDIKSIIQTDTKSLQAYAEPLQWLDKNAPKESVIWSNGRISSYIPTQTAHFQLFSSLGGLHLMPSREVEERYLTSHYFDNLTLEDIKKDFRQYAGAGNAIHQYKTHNRKVRICQMLLLSRLGVGCGQTTNAVAFKGEKYFDDLYNQYKGITKSNITARLKKFNVGYILRDKATNNEFVPDKIPDTKLIWNNDRFEIYYLNFLNK